MALFTLLLAGAASVSAQESLGEKARRIREQRENAAQNAAEGQSPAAGQTAGQKSMAPTAADLSITLSLISETDPEKYSGGVRLLLEQERFRALDDVAMGDRANKTRFAGGEWKLRAFYDAIASPQDKGRGVVADWNAYRDRLNRWITRQPESVTARVALAQAELMFAMQIRGPAELGTVPPQRQRLYSERLKAAETLLNQGTELNHAAGPQGLCPEWYLVMMQVGRAQGWELQDLTALSERAIAFEPQYFYFYQQQALTLTPRWRGKEGDAEKFAEESANKTGGKPGDVLYWLIAQSILSNPDLVRMQQHFVWSRALIGYQALVEQFGTSPMRQNQIAFMSARFGDYMTADDTLQQIGDKWSPAVWGTQEYFDQVRSWARSSSGPFKKMIEAYKAVNANIATPEGQRYDGQIAKEFSARYSHTVQDCKAKASNAAPTLLILKVGNSGAVQQMLVVPETANDACLRPKLEKASFSPPPKPEYWVRVSLK